MHLFVGLGNPGARYAGHRHNVGFMVAETIAGRYSFAAPRKKFQGTVAEGRIAGGKVLLLKPETQMNLSGNSVAAAARFYKVPIGKVVVFHDELDLAPGKVRVKTSGGEAGHNGLRSISSHLGKDYRRVRIGIGHPGDKAKVTGHVLGDFSKADRVWLEPLLDAIADSAAWLVTDDDPRFRSEVARLAPPPVPAESSALSE